MIGAVLRALRWSSSKSARVARSDALGENPHAFKLHVRPELRVDPTQKATNQLAAPKTHRDKQPDAAQDTTGSHEAATRPDTPRKQKPSKSSGRNRGRGAILSETCSCAVGTFTHVLCACLVPPSFGRLRWRLKDALLRGIAT